jgi:hypothetical protein
VATTGAPPKWLPPATTQTLSEDKDDYGPYYRDQNAARYSHGLVAPAVRSIYEVQSYFPAHDIELFCCSNIVGNLHSSALRIQSSSSESPIIPRKPSKAFAGIETPSQTPILSGKRLSRFCFSPPHHQIPVRRTQSPSSIRERWFPWKPPARRYVKQIGYSQNPRRRP